MDEIVGRNCRFLVDPAPWSQSLDPQWPHKMGGKTMPVAPPPSHHIFSSWYEWYVYHSQSWVVYGIVLPTLILKTTTIG